MIQESLSTSSPNLRIGVGMSGGLDSSVVAALCLEKGYEVIGFTLHLFKEGSRCCSIEDVERSRRVCHHLGIRHYVINAVDLFQETIIDPFIETYARGLTPSPCVLCNQYVKFGILHRRALQLDCGHVATGHYVRIEERNGKWHLFQARDRKKDQSYFLHRLSQEQLSHCLFPLEGWTKQEVAVYAEQRGLPVSTSSKAESQDLCFVSDDGHGRFIEERRPELRRQGTITDSKGRPLGKHPGFHHFTIGQRKGLGVATGSKMYVKGIEARSNRVVIGGREEVMEKECMVDDLHWIAGAPPADAFSCNARIRYRHKAALCRVTVLASGRVQLLFAEPQFAITPGQAAVLYQGDEILGGGWIASR